MNEQEQTSVEYLLAILDDLLCDKILLDFSTYKQICLSAREIYHNELKQSFEKGYEEGVLYVSKFNRKENGFPF